MHQVPPDHLLVAFKKLLERVRIAFSDLFYQLLIS
jgi:hypothetical protein